MKSVIDFLRRLERNNNKQWFDEHKKEYKEALARFNAFTQEFIDGISTFDSTVAGLTPKDCTYRIYNDMRFHNKPPYKTHMGTYVCKGGKKSGNAGYYFHIEPTSENYLGGNMLSAGIYMPEPAVLHSIREDICYNGEEFFGTVKKTEKAGFVFDTDGKLKKVPAGFPADTPYAEYLKFKNLNVMRFVDEEFITAPGLAGRLVEIFATTGDFVRHLNRSVDYARDEN